MKDDAAVGGADHRLIGDDDAALVERGDDLVGDRRLAPTRFAQRLAGRINGEAARLARRLIEGLFGALQQPAGAASVTRRNRRADAHRDRQRAGDRRRPLFADPLGEPGRRDRQLLFAARRQ